MKPRAKLSVVPPGSAINTRLAESYYYDSYAISVSNTPLTALGCFLASVANTPAWVNLLMALRNKIVRLVGLKDLGSLGGFDSSKPESAYAPGDRVGIFTLISNTSNEVLLSDSDKHLDVVLSVYMHPSGTGSNQSVSVTTVVHTHNMLGRLYMLPVTPLHKLIVPSVLSRIIVEEHAA
jgi:hypothetical protein